MKKLSTCFSPSDETRNDILATKSNSILKFIPLVIYEKLERIIPDNLKFQVVEFTELGYKHLIFDELLYTILVKQEIANEKDVSKGQDTPAISPTNTST